MLSGGTNHTGAGPDWQRAFLVTDIASLFPDMTTLCLLFLNRESRQVTAIMAECLAFAKHLAGRAQTQSSLGSSGFQMCVGRAQQLGCKQMP